MEGGSHSLVDQLDLNHSEHEPHTPFRLQGPGKRFQIVLKLEKSPSSTKCFMSFTIRHCTTGPPIDLEWLGYWSRELERANLGSNIIIGTCSRGIH